MKHTLLSSLVLSTTLTFVLSANAQVAIGVKSIYGKDNRVEIDDYPNPLFVKKANAIAVKIPTNKLKPISSSYFSFPDKPIQDVRQLCEGIPFNEQPEPGECTGFLVGPKTLVTAGHCVKGLIDCEKDSWVFGFKLGVDVFESTQIYSCKNIISQQFIIEDNKHTDYAVIELDREVEGTTPLSYRKEGAIEKNTPLVVIGHPSGLPMKAADGAVVKTQGGFAFNSKLKKRPNFFAANLDTFGGNSGSPVFNQTTGLVEGILVKGRDDYKYDRSAGCYRLEKYLDNNLEDFEMVMRINKVEGLDK